MMRLRIGHRMTITCPQDTPLITMVTPHVERHGDYLAPEVMTTTPDVPVHSYFDLYGNICRRMVAPAGTFTLSSDVTLRDNDPRDDIDLDAPEWPVTALPDNVLIYTTGSRYIETDLMAARAWDLFGNVPSGWRRVQHIVDWAHDHLTFDYKQARPTRTANDALNEGVGVCRDFAHLALGMLRSMNIPARYVNGYIGDIGVPWTGAAMDFSAWIEVFLGGRWYTFDPRNNDGRIGRVVIARGRDATDVPLINSYGPHDLDEFVVWCDPVDEAGTKVQVPIEPPRPKVA